MHLRKLAAHSAVYGAADVFQSLVNLLLVPLYTSFLSAADYGTLALLLLFGTVAKIVFRLGLDGGFFRVHYETSGAFWRGQSPSSRPAWAPCSSQARWPRPGPWPAWCWERMRQTSGG